MFSVIVPVYNGGEYLSRCLQSFVGQTSKDFELICINDGLKRDISESRFCGRRNNNFFDKEKFGLFSLKGGYCAFFEEIGPLFLEKIFTMDRNCERKMRLLRKIRITIAFFRRLLYNVEER